MCVWGRGNGSIWSMFSDTSSSIKKFNLDGKYGNDNCVVIAVNYTRQGYIVIVEFFPCVSKIEPLKITMRIKEACITSDICVGIKTTFTLSHNLWSVKGILPNYCCLCNYF